MPWDRSGHEEEKGQRTPEGVVEVGLPGLKFMRKERKPWCQ